MFSGNKNVPLQRHDIMVWSVFHCVNQNFVHIINLVMVATECNSCLCTANRAYYIC